MRAFHLDDDEIETIKDLRKLSAHERRVIMRAIHRSASDLNQPPDPGENVVPIHTVES